MKILRKGEIKTPTYLFECVKCGCVFECERNEIRSGYDEPYGLISSCVCPTPGCGNEVIYEKVRKGV